MANSINRMEMSLNKAIDLAIETCIKLKENKKLFNIFYLVGPPGIGKTMSIISKCSQMNIGILSYEPALERIEKFGGIPDLKWIDSEKNILHTIWSVPQIICEINKESEKYKNLVVLFDDWHLCTEDIQQIGFELFSYYSLNGHQIPGNVIFILSGNEASSAGAKILLTAVKNRCCLIYTYPDVNDWIHNWAIKNNILSSGISFFQQSENEQYFKEEENTTEPFGSARSWTSAFNMISMLETNGKYTNSKGKLNNEYLIPILQGHVSKIATEKFSIWYRILSEINVEEIYKTGEFTIPENNINKFAFSHAITTEFYTRIITNKDVKETCTVFIDILENLYAECPEIAIKNIRHLLDIPKEENKKSGSEIISIIASKNEVFKDILQKIAHGSNILGKISSQ